MIAGLVSSYREGALLDGAIRSLLPAVDFVLCLEAGIGGDTRPTQTLPTDLYKDQRVRFCAAGLPFTTDATKRTNLIDWAQRSRAEWAVILDGDEVLMHPEHLRAMIERTAERADEIGSPVIGMPLRIVELDGSVAMMHTRILRVAAIESYIVSSNVLRLTTGAVVEKPNEKLCGAGGWPVELQTIVEPSQDAVELHLARCRGPVGGEPYVWHRSLWRSSGRDVERQHLAEGRWWSDPANVATVRP